MDNAEVMVRGGEITEGLEQCGEGAGDIKLAEDIARFRNLLDQLLDQDLMELRDFLNCADKSKIRYNPI